MGRVCQRWHIGGFLSVSYNFLIEALAWNLLFSLVSCVFIAFLLVVCIILVIVH